MFNEPRKILFRGLGIILFIGILIFAYFKYNSYIQGPEIVQINIESFMSTGEPFIWVRSEIKNTQSININGRNIVLKNRENFDEIIVFSPGKNTIEISLTDKFGKTRLYTYNIYYKPAETTNIQTLEQARESPEEPESKLTQEEIN